MKFLRLTVTSLFALILIGMTACSMSGYPAQAEQKVTVTRGDLFVKVNGTGKTAYASDARLSFGTAGKVEQLPVKKGDTVARGDVLAKLDTDALELALSQAIAAEAQAKTAVVQAERGEAEAVQALYAAQFELDRIKEVSDIKDDIMALEWRIKTLETNRSQATATGNSSTVRTLNEMIRETNLELEERNQDLQELLAKDAYNGVAPYEVKAFNIGGQRYDRLIVEDIRLKQQQVLLAEKAIEQTKLGIEQARANLDQAAKAVQVAQKQLDDATITSPIDGLVADLAIEQGEFCGAPGAESGIPVYVVDPGSLEIETEIDEIDVAGIKLGQKAMIRLDALPDRSFEGTVTSVSVMPVVKSQNSGVVVYMVKVGFTGVPPAEAKPGMSASIDIISLEKTNVILAPNKSIKRDSQGRTTVNVIVNEKIEERPVTLGVSDGNMTEIVSGLEEGELVTRSVKETNEKLS